MTNIYVGNALSFLSAIFICVSALSRGRGRIYLYQSFECAFLTASQLFFGQSGAALIMLFGVLRNLLLAFGVYNTPWMLLFLVLTAYFGIKFNTGGIIGLIPVFATLIYIVTSKYAKGYINVKLALLFNLSLWVFYSALIMDYVSATVNFFAATFAVISLLTHKGRIRSSAGKK